MILPKVKINKILYATDLSDSARYAFAYAVSIANIYKASITLLHVVFDYDNIDLIAARYIGKENWLKIRRKVYDDAKNALIDKKRDNIAIKEVLYKFSENAKTENEKRRSVTDEIVVKAGKPEDIILEQAEERNCDIIVMGGYSQGVLADAVIGSTSRRVLRKSKKPVLVIPLSKKGDTSF